MTDHTQDDKLIALPPKDLILSLRRGALERINGERSRQKAERLRQKIENAKNTHEFLLKEFTAKFLQDDKIYDTLKPKGKNELTKIYAFICKKQIILKTLPFAVISGIITGLGVWNSFTLVISFISVFILSLLGVVLFETSGWWGGFHLRFYVRF